MKKVIYSIFSVSFLLFTACTEDRGTTSEVVDSNRHETVNQSHIQDYDQTGTARTSTTDADYQARSQQISQQMATDMQLQEAEKQRVAAIVYDRERRLGELENRYNYSETTSMGGQARVETDTRANTGTVTEENRRLNVETGTNMETSSTAMTSERNSIMADADKELKAVLTPEQYNLFVKNRKNYDELKYKNDATDTKIKSEDDEMKYKSGDDKIKVDGNETKIKTENEKIKIERK